MVGGLLVSAVLPLPAPGMLEAQEPRSPAELSNFERHTSHDEMAAYLKEVGEVAHDMALETYGRSHQGRDLWMAVFSRPRVTTPAEAGKPILVLGANVHGYNYTLRESLLVMIRELGTPGTELNELLDRVIVMVVPSKNPDGVEAGTRFNALDADLNRDYMTLDHPEMAAYIGNVINHWEPHLYVDGHDGGAVQYGGAYPYSLLYQAAGLAGADPSLTALADREIFPLRDRKSKRPFDRFRYDRWLGIGGSRLMTRGG